MEPSTCTLPIFQIDPAVNTITGQVIYCLKLSTILSDFVTLPVAPNMGGQSPRKPTQLAKLK